MLTIAIPTYNYPVKRLVSELVQQAKTLTVAWELLVYEDGSTQHTVHNQSICEELRVTYFSSKENLGRTQARQALTEKAQFENILFLDADMLPKHSNFLTVYVAHLAKAAVVFGGIAYEDTPPTHDRILRWKYGRKRETLRTDVREEKPYLSINSGCFLIDKSLFERLNAKMHQARYGLDLYFKKLLQEANATILHIENPALHLGLESSEVFLKKSLQAVDTLYFLEQEGIIAKDHYPIQKAYLTLKRWGGISIFRFYLRKQEKRFKKNLVSATPTLKKLDLLKLYHYIQLQHAK